MYNKNLTLKFKFIFKYHHIILFTENYKQITLHIYVVIFFEIIYIILFLNCTFIDNKVKQSKMGA